MKTLTLNQLKAWLLKLEEVWIGAKNMVGVVLKSVLLALVILLMGGSFLLALFVGCILFLVDMKLIRKEKDLVRVNKDGQVRDA